jgi:4a-hydroxytetrahydrobiopterin dehydratase
MDLPKSPTRRNRFHIDIFVPPDQGEARVQAALAAGGRVLDDSHAPDWWSLEDPEGNVADIATLANRD